MTTDRGGEAWAELERRLIASRERLAPARAAAPESARAILDARARALAQTADPPAWGASFEALTFALGNEVYALEARYLRAIARLDHFSSIPGAAPPLLGVTVWRGELLTILELRQLLGISAPGAGDLRYVLVLGESRPVFGILVDRVADLIRIPVSTIRTPAEGVAIRRDHIRGITGDATLVLDASALLQSHG